MPLPLLAMKFGWRCAADSVWGKMGGKKMHPRRH